MEQTPVVKSLLRPLNIKGCPYEMFSIGMTVSIALLFLFFIFGHGFLGIIVGVALFAALFSIGRWAAANDPQLLTVMVSSLAWKSSLDSRKHVRRNPGA